MLHIFGQKVAFPCFILLRVLGETSVINGTLFAGRMSFPCPTNSSVRSPNQTGNIDLGFIVFFVTTKPWEVGRGVHPWGNEARCVAEISGGGGSLEILYNVMQRPVGHDQRAYSTGMLGKPKDSYNLVKKPGS